MKMKRLLSGVGRTMLAVTLVLAMQSQAQALSISLFDGSTTVTCADGGSCDLDATSGNGQVIFSGGVGTWTANVTVALSYPALGSPSQANLDLSSVHVSSLAGGTLQIKASQTGFTGPISSGGSAWISQAVGGTIGSGAGNSALFNAYLDSTNVLFAMTTSLGTLGSFGPGAFSGSTGGFAATGSPFSLTAVADLTHVNGTSSSFDYALVSEPATLLLLGSGLVGMGWFGRRKIKESADEKA